jgi:hypothetical protein
MPTDPLRLALLAVPLFALGFGAGALRALGRREGLPPGPLWLVLAAILRIW